MISFQAGRSLFRGGDEIIPVINLLQQQFELVVATQDWHPPQHKSFASSHEQRNEFDTIQWLGTQQVLWPDHCVQGTEGADFSALLDTKKVSAIFRKGMSPEIDSCSGFDDNGHLKSTGLSFYLKGLNVTELYFAGLAGDSVFTLLPKTPSPEASRFTYWKILPVQSALTVLIKQRLI